MTIRMISPSGHPGDIHPDEVAHMLSHGWTVIADDAAPAGGDEIQFSPDVAGAAQGQPEANADGCPLTNDELRAAIEAATGAAPHHRTGRAKLLALYADATKDTA